MSDFMQKSSVLVLNSLFQPVGTVTPKKALIAMNSGVDEGKYSAKAIDIIYSKKIDGSFDLDNVLNFATYNFEEWLMVDFREGLDIYVNTPKIKIRCPTIIITNYSKMPMRRFRPTKFKLYELQGGRCGYTNKIIPFKKGNIEHKRPKSRGGKDTFENLMFVDAEVNNKRGNKPLKKIGLTPLFFHKEPAPTPAACMIKSPMHPDWNYFMLR